MHIDDILNDFTSYRVWDCWLHILLPLNRLHAIFHHNMTHRNGLEYVGVKSMNHQNWCIYLTFINKITPTKKLFWRQEGFLTGKFLDVGNRMVIMLSHTFQQGFQDILIVDSINDAKLDRSIGLGRLKKAVWTQSNHANTARQFPVLVHIRHIAGWQVIAILIFEGHLEGTAGSDPIRAAKRLQVEVWISIFWF